MSCWYFTREWGQWASESSPPSLWVKVDLGVVWHVSQFTFLWGITETWLRRENRILNSICLNERFEVIWAPWYNLSFWSEPFISVAVIDSLDWVSNAMCHVKIGCGFRFTQWRVNPKLLWRTALRTQDCFQETFCLDSSVLCDCLELSSVGGFALECQKCVPQYMHAFLLYGLFWGPFFASKFQ